MHQVTDARRIADDLQLAIKLPVVSDGTWPSRTAHRTAPTDRWVSPSGRWAPMWTGRQHRHQLRRKGQQHSSQDLVRRQSLDVPA